MSCPRESHLRASKEVLQYLAGTQTHGTVFDCNHLSTALLAYSDASYGTVYDGKSYTGWLVQYCRSSVSWTSTVQRCTAQSTMESELIAASEISKELRLCYTASLLCSGDISLHHLRVRPSSPNYNNQDACQPYTLISHTTPKSIITT